MQTELYPRIFSQPRLRSLRDRHPLRHPHSLSEKNNNIALHARWPGSFSILRMHALTSPEKRPPHILLPPASPDEYAQTQKQKQKQK